MRGFVLEDVRRRLRIRDVLRGLDLVAERDLITCLIGRTARQVNGAPRDHATSATTAGPIMLGDENITGYSRGACCRLGSCTSRRSAACSR